MATSSDVVCGTCDSQFLTKTAEYWCQECDEGLCADCNKHHGVSKASRNHKAIPITNYKKLPQSILQISNHCEEHEFKYQNYCPHHLPLCCPVCMATSHTKCVDLMSVPEVIETSKLSTSLENLEQNLRNIHDYINKVIENREQNLSKVQEQRQRYHDEVKLVRVQINSHLDELEQKILRELYTAEKHITANFEQLIQQLREKRSVVTTLQSEISAIKDYASDRQKFLAVKTVESTAMTEDQFLQNLLKDERLHVNQLNLELYIDNEIKNIRSNLKRFGCVLVEAGDKTVVLESNTDKQAQTTCVVPQSSSIRDYGRPNNTYQCCIL